jgi:hypothetical protein
MTVIVLMGARTYDQQFGRGARGGVRSGSAERE